MKSIVNIENNHGVLEMILEKKDNQNGTKFCKTNNINMIYEFFKKIKYDIKDIYISDNKINITLKNGVSLQITKDINCNNLEIFKPLVEGIKYFNRKEKRKRQFRITLFGIMFFSIIGGVKFTKEQSANFSSSAQYVSDLNTNDLEEEPVNDDIPEENNDVSATESINTRLMEEETIKLMNRIHTQSLEEVNYQEYLPSFGTCSYDSKYLSVIENYGNIVRKMAEISGIDEDIITCVLAQERGIHSSVLDEGGAIGISQIQVNQHLGSTLTLYNVMTDEEETFVVTMELLQSAEGNIKVGVSLLQRALIVFKGNILLALQAYNYGEGAVLTVVKRTGYTLDEINENFRDISWVEEVYDYSNRKGGYGDKVYIDNVLSRYPSDELTIIYGDNPTVVNLKLIEKVKRMVI